MKPVKKHIAIVSVFKTWHLVVDPGTTVGEALARFVIWDFALTLPDVGLLGPDVDLYRLADRYSTVYAVPRRAVAHRDRVSDLALSDDAAAIRVA